MLIPFDSTSSSGSSGEGSHGSGSAPAASSARGRLALENQVWQVSGAWPGFSWTLWDSDRWANCSRTTTVSDIASDLPSRTPTYRRWSTAVGPTHTNLEDASTHKSANTTPAPGNVFVTSDLDVWPFDHKINRFPGLIVEHVCFKFGYPIAASVLEMTCGTTDTQTHGSKNRTLASAVAVGNVTFSWSWQCVHEFTVDSRGAQPRFF